MISLASLCWSGRRVLYRWMRSCARSRSSWISGSMAQKYSPAWRRSLWVIGWGGVVMCGWSG